MSSGLAKNTLYLTLASVAQKAIAFIYFAIIARFFGTEDTGAYFIALAVVTVIMVLDDLGLTSVLIRETAKKKAEALVWIRSVMGVKIVTIPITVAVAFVAPLVLGLSSEASTLVRIAVLVMLADTLSLSFYGVLRGLQNLKYESLGIFIGQSITASIGIVLMATGTATLPLLIVALIAGSSWNVFFSVTNVVRRLGWKAMLPTYTLGWKPLKMAFAFFLAAAFVKVYSYVDSFTLQRVIGEAAVGEYAVAYKLTYAFQFLPLAFVAALYPTMSAQAHDAVKLKKTLLDSFWYMALMGFPIVFGIFAIAPEIVNAFYGADFSGSVLPLQVLIFVLLFIFLDFPIGSLLNATDRQHVKTGIMGATMVVNVVANLLLIPRVGIVGASIAGILSFVFMFVAGWYFMQQVVKVSFREMFGRVGGLFVAAVIMAAVVWTVKPLVHFVLAVPLGAVVFFVVAVGLKAIRAEHFISAKRLFSRKPYVECTLSDR